jgi:hypothetical protein
MNKQTLMCVLLAMVAAGVAGAVDEAPDTVQTLMITQSVDAMPKPPVPVPPGATVSFDPSQSVDGNGSVRIDYESAEPRSLVLYEVPNPGMENGTVWYEASLRAENLKSIAYLEMWCDFGEGQYFSRGLDQVVQGDTGWEHSRIPFMLKADEVPKRFLLGVRMEGPGTVWLDDIRLTTAPLPGVNAAARKSLRFALVGAGLGLFGALCGLWGALAGFLAQRGRARGFVVTTGWVFTAGGFVVLLAGVILMGANSPLGWPCLLTGFIITLVLTPLNFVMRRAYRQAEMRRLTAQEL